MWATLVTAWGSDQVDRKEGGLWRGSCQVARASTVLQAPVKSFVLIDEQFFTEKC